MYSAFEAWGTLSSRRVQILSWGWWKGKRDGRPPEPLQDVLPRNWDGTEHNRTAICMVLRATDNDRNTFSPLPRGI
ncbi:hypothetical protein TNCV_2209801 [Trichonephila clavipes]|nr:hypothetical protein TNCV_2209801 [Trichonephila clavipes]